MLILGIIILCITAMVCCVILRPGIPQEEGSPRIGFVFTDDGDDWEGENSIPHKTNGIGIPELPEVKRSHESEVIGDVTTGKGVS